MASHRRDQLRVIRCREQLYQNGHRCALIERRLLEAWWGPWLSQRTRTWGRVAWLIFGVDVILAVVILVLSSGTAIVFPLSGLWMISFAGWALSRHVDTRNYMRRRSR